jgi:hypothetical protein
VQDHPGADTSPALLDEAWTARQLAIWLHTYLQQTAPATRAY